MLGVAAIWEAITAVCMVVITLAIVATAAGVVFVALKVKSLVAKVSGQVTPIAEKGERILESVGRTADSAGDHIQRVAQQAEETCSFVGDRVRSVVAVIADLVSHPLISAAALAAAVRRAIEALSSQSEQTTSQH
jgi:predicted PurR-regulated permease PerM